MAQLSQRIYLKCILLMVGVVNFVFGILLLVSGFVVKDKLDDIKNYSKNLIEASQYWAGIPIILIGLFTIFVALKPNELILNIVGKIFLLISLILALAVIVAEAGDRGGLYAVEIGACKSAERYKRDPFVDRRDARVAIKRCDLYNAVRHWYGALVFSAVVLFGSSLMGLLSLFANVISLMGKISGGNSMSVGHAQEVRSHRVTALRTVIVK